MVVNSLLQTLYYERYKIGYTILHAKAIIGSQIKTGNQILRTDHSGGPRGLSVQPSRWTV